MLVFMVFHIQRSMVSERLQKTRSCGLAFIFGDRKNQDGRKASGVTAQERRGGHLSYNGVWHVQKPHT